MISEKIYNLRKSKNLSQEELANVLNVSRQTISKWETGESNPDFDKIVPLCDYFGISTDELLKNKVDEKESVKIEKNKNPFLISLCIGIFTLMTILLFFFEEHGASDALMASVSMVSLSAIAIIIVYMFSGRKKEKLDPKLKLINSIFYISIVIIYIILSSVIDYDYAFIVIVILILIKKVIELIKLLGGSK